MKPSLLNDVAAILFEKLCDEARDWLCTSLNRLTALSDNEKACTDFYLCCSAMARRRLGTDVIECAPSSLCWRADEVGRVLLLKKKLELIKRKSACDLVGELFRHADEYEQIAMIKGLNLLDHRGEMAEMMILAGRTNSVRVFAVVALNNPYPAQFYDDRSFHQLVLKALFMDLNLAEMVGLQERLNRRLSVLCMELVHERLTAHRSPPESIWLAMNPDHLTSTDRQCYFRFNQS